MQEDTDPVIDLFKNSQIYLEIFLYYNSFSV
jgi:hypothetical protein